MPSLSSVAPSVPHWWHGHSTETRRERSRASGPRIQQAVSGAWRALGTEAVVTFLLVVVVAAVATTAKVPAGVAALAIGLTLAAAILISGPLTGAEVNPARAIGPMIVAGKFTDWW